MNTPPPNDPLTPIEALVFRLADAELLFIDDFFKAYDSLTPRDQALVDELYRWATIETGPNCQPPG